MQKNMTLDLQIPNNFNKLYERFDQITQRGQAAGLKTVSEDLRKIMIEATAKLAAYMQAAALADEMFRAGLPVDHVPDEIDIRTNNALNKLDDQMTLEISALT